MKKIFAIKRASVILMAVILSVATYVTVSANPEQKEGIDALLLIDTSGSMRSSDSSRNALEATKMFIDMLETQNSRVGIIGFNDSLTGVVDITEIGSAEDKERLKSAVDEFNYDGYTDIGLPLKEAVGIMSRNMRSTNSPMVLLLTDGNIEMDPENPDRTEENSYEDIVDAVTATGKDLPIYTIGLNYDGSVDRQLLKTISENTGARSYIISQAIELPQIFNEIFADHVKSSLIEVAAFTADGDSYTDVAIDIDSDFVAVANIIALSEYELLDARLFDNTGTETVFDQSTITFSSSRKYSIIKVLFPAKGIWKLQVKGVSGDNIRVNLIYQYNINVDVEVIQPEAIGSLFSPDSPVTVNGYIMVNGERVEDDTLYRSTASNAIVTDMEGNLVAKVPLTSTPEGLSGSFTPTGDAPLLVYIETIASTFMKESPEVVVQFEPIIEVPEPTGAPAVTETPAEGEEAAEELPEEPEEGAGRIIWVYVVAAVVIVMLLALTIVAFIRRRKPKFFEGFLEIRAMDEDGVYTSLEAPALHTYVGKIDLKFFLNDNMPSKVKNQLALLPFNLKNIFISPSATGSGSAIVLENKSGSLITDESGASIGTKKYIWRPDEKLTVAGAHDSLAKLELTYRLEEL